MSDLREESEEAIAAAAQEERLAHAALVEGRTARSSEWGEDEEEAHQARLARWRAASRALVDALERLKRA